MTTADGTRMRANGALFSVLRNDKLDLRVLPTEQCNFRCTYCYETFKHKRMPPTVVRGVKALIDRRAASLTELHLDWFGGEPLVAFDVVRDISGHALRVTEAHAIHFTSGMTTNGYFLDRPCFQKCLDLKINAFQISLDGKKEVHDRSRVLGSGGGTFDRIWSNLLGMRATERTFNVVLRVHYTKENHAHIADLAGLLGDTFGGDRRFTVYFRHIARLGGPNDDKIAVPSPAERAVIEAGLHKALGHDQVSSVDETYVCYAAHANSLVIRSNGKLSKCTVALEDDFNIIGELSEKGEIVADQTKFQRWISPALEGRWEDLACPLHLVSQRAKAAAEAVPLG